MSDIALRPRSATELVDAAFQVYRAEPLQFIVGLGLIYVPWLAIAAAFNVDPNAPNAASAASIVLAPVAIVVYALASGVTMSLANDVYFGRKADIAAAFRQSVRRLWSLIATTLAVGLMIGAGAGLLIALSLPLSPLARLALDAPVIAAGAIYLGVRFFAARPCVILEGRSTEAALARSWRLGAGQFWHVFGSLLLAIIIVMVVVIGEAALAQAIPSRVVQAALSALASVLVVPLFSITETLLYYDLRIRNEGFDLEYLAASMPVPEQVGS